MLCTCTRVKIHEISYKSSLVLYICILTNFIHCLNTWLNAFCSSKTKLCVICTTHMLSPCYPWVSIKTLSYRYNFSCVWFKHKSFSWHTSLVDHHDSILNPLHSYLSCRSPCSKRNPRFPFGPNHAYLNVVNPSMWNFIKIVSYSFHLALGNLSYLICRSLQFRPPLAWVGCFPFNYLIKYHASYLHKAMFFILTSLLLVFILSQHDLTIWRNSSWSINIT